MSKHSSPALTMRDALYEAPGPKMRAKIRIGTAISLGCRRRARRPRYCSAFM